MKNVFFSLNVILLLALVQGCSGNGFHLRKKVELAPQFDKVFIQGQDVNAEFKMILDDALTEAGGSVTSDSGLATSTLQFSRVEEGRRVTAYDSDREAREYLVYLIVEYSVLSKKQTNKTSKTSKASKESKQRINIDQSYLYDSDFALGKAEEEKRVKLALYEEATRLILLRLQYSTTE